MIQTTKYKGIENKVQLPGKIVKTRREEDRKEVELLKKKKESNIMKDADKERRVFPVSSGWLCLDFSRGWGQNHLNIT